MAEQAALLARAAAPSLPQMPPPPNAAPAEEPPPEYTGICACCKWFVSGSICTRKKFVFVGWIVCGLLSIVFFWLYLDQEAEVINTGYILCCSLAILMSIYATFNFRDVLRLRAAVNDLVDNTKALAEQRDKIRNEVGRLQKAHLKLEGIEGKLARSNETLRKNFTKFEDWNNVINKQVKDNTANAKSIKGDFQQAITQYRKLLIQNERAILDKAYRQIENRDGESGLSKEEFHDLIQSLPARYKLRFEELEQEGMTFEELAGDDHIIDHNEFTQFMDAMAEQQANCGIDVEKLGIQEKKKARKRDDDEDDDDDKDDEKGP